MTLLLQVSDTHFGTERPVVMDALLRLARARAPDVLVLSGDITQRARRSQFAAARAFVERLGIADRIVIPGNHDIPLFNLAARVFTPYAGHRHAFGSDLEPSFESADLLVLGVNTTRPRRQADGEVSARQVARVAKRLERASPAQLRIVVTHQPVAVPPGEDESNVLHGSDAAVREWARAGADLILGGHIHLPFVVPLHERFAGLARQVWGVQAGTAVSSRTRAEADNSVNLIRCAAPGDGLRRAILDRWDFTPATGAFERVAQSEFGFADGR